ncbi:PREDICTED: CUB and zona pellucida-like domain-containing protein 1 [Buceros rhinoceros silvestris]|nr:PREDICTED: CUB and zona pellucida-like domain-containing protein 1 [Buceros rhinoceros silvestris]
MVSRQAMVHGQSSSVRQALHEPETAESPLQAQSQRSPFQLSRLGPRQLQHQVVIAVTCYRITESFGLQETFKIIKSSRLPSIAKRRSVLFPSELEDQNGTPRCGASLQELNKALKIELNANASCTWQIQRNANQTVRLIFSYFQFAPSSSCETESIKVYDGPSTNSPLLGQVCNTTDAVPVLESSSDSATFLITTNSVAFKRNFFVFYYYFSPGTKIKNCGGQLAGPNGTLISPNYPASYPPFTYCVWHIQTAKNTKIKLQFQDFFLELDPNCQFDFAAVYDGRTTNTGLLGKACGVARPAFESSSNTMTVVLSTDYANSYRGFSAQYTSVPLPAPAEPDTVFLTCSSESMKIVLSKSYLASLGYNETHLQLNDPSCRPVVTESVIFSFPLASCGTTKKDEGHSITYTNIVTLFATGNIITRQKSIQIIAKCRMENNSTLEVIYVTQNNTIQNTTAAGRYNVSMAFYDSDSFSTPVHQFPYYVELNQTLFAQVSLYSTDPNLLVFVDTCTASPQPDFGSLTYDLIRSGCNKDDTVVTYPPREHYGRFKFNAFRFLRGSPSVYLQCDILICDSKSPSSRCTEGCVSRHKRDLSSYIWKTNTVVGPIRLRRALRSGDHSGSLTKAAAEESPSLQQYSFYGLSFVVLISNVIIVVAVILKHHKHHAGYGYQTIQSSS